MKIKVLFLIVVSLIAGNHLMAQKKNRKLSLSGYVTDENKNPVKGAMIFVDKKDSHISTGDNGFFSIKIRPKATVVSVITMDNRVANEFIEGRSSINLIVARPDSTRLRILNKTDNRQNEVIDMGIMTVKSRNRSTSANKPTISENEKIAYRSIYEMIKGRVPGVEVNGTSIRIQGINSMFTDNQPLFVVNGMPSVSIDNIDPYMVESISVLKGAAAAIYGSRGAYGVIVINTKSNLKDK